MLISLDQSDSLRSHSQAREILGEALQVESAHFAQAKLGPITPPCGGRTRCTGDATVVVDTKAII